MRARAMRSTSRRSLSCDLMAAFRSSAMVCLIDIGHLRVGLGEGPVYPPGALPDILRPMQTGLSAADRLIVALDVPTNDEARALVRAMDGVVSFYKLGLELTLAGGLRELI